MASRSARGCNSAVGRQELPSAMTAAPYGLDHVVVLVDDLDEAARRYERLGFATAPLMRHPFGTGNRLVMLQQSFIELVGILDPGALTGPGTLIANRLKLAGPGAWGLALLGVDIERNREQLTGLGLACGDVGHGSRPVPLPDGTDGLARFSTLMLPSPAGLEPLLLFLAEQHVPEVVWIPEWQRHANGARALDRVTCLAPNPCGGLPLLQALYGASQVAIRESSITATTPLGVIETIGLTEARKRYGINSAALSGRIAAVRVATADRERARGAIEKAGVATATAPDGAFLVDPADACGVWLEFA
jgi:hypothetical protein